MHAGSDQPERAWTPARLVPTLLVLLAVSPAVARAEMGPCRPDQHDSLVCGSGNGAARVIAETTSPSGKLALAWRWPGGPPTEEPDEDQAETVQVRLADGAILARSKTSYWSTGEMRANRLDESATWSPNSRLVVRQLDTRFESEAFQLHALAGDGKLAGTVDLRKLIEPALRKQIRERGRNPRSYVFFVSHDEPTRLSNSGLLRATVSMWVPKDGPEAAFDVTVQATPSVTALTARLVSVKTSRAGR
ncbi:MAG: hypothetical protein IT537_07530 [Hyphomicrobiales bacterium]|nr:hypothetical protein [Hyphomicrobiales bacterium]